MNAPFPNQIPTLMLQRYGPLKDGLEFVSKNQPKPGHDQVLIRTEAVGLNPHDVKLALGELRRHEPLDLPAPLGGDISGVVEAVGPNVAKFKPGQAIFGIAQGSLGRLALANIDEITTLPKGLSFESSAGLPVAGLTTIQAFRRIGGLKAGDRVLIHAGAGGVGSFAIQYAKSFGATVYTTASLRNVALLQGLGADRVIDYHNEDYREICRDLDVVFDTLGGDATFDAFKVLRPGGRLASIVPAEITAHVARELALPLAVRAVLGLKPSRIRRLCKAHKVAYAFTFMRPNPADLQTLANLATRRVIRPVCDRVYPFAKSIEALEHLSKGHARGKVIVSFCEAPEDQRPLRQTRHQPQALAR